MAPLPYIDEHAREIAAPPEQVWDAVAATLWKSFRDVPSWLAAAWGLRHATHSGDWHSKVAVGDTVPGFAAAEVEPPRVLTLRGRHRFSDYELRFELEPLSTASTYLRARSSAAFPGVKGRVYRLLVIGTRGHRVAMGMILAAVARRAQREPTQPVDGRRGRSALPSLTVSCQDADGQHILTVRADLPIRWVDGAW